ncbi:hypothetical protein V866_001789 [Kwoniella sp. B9012]
MNTGLLNLSDDILQHIGSLLHGDADIPLPSFHPHTLNLATEIDPALLENKNDARQSVREGIRRLHNRPSLHWKRLACSLANLFNLSNVAQILGGNCHQTLTSLCIPTCAQSLALGSKSLRMLKLTNFQWVNQDVTIIEELQNKDTYLSHCLRTLYAKIDGSTDGIASL